MAAEASQLTFIALAQKAKSLTSCVSLGGWFREISPDSVDTCTGRALTEAMSNRVSSMRLAQASEIAVELLETEGAYEVLATLLETTKLDKPEVKLALELTRGIPDETRRTTVVKHLESLTFPW